MITYIALLSFYIHVLNQKNICLASQRSRIPGKSNKMVGENFLHSIQIYTHVHRFPSRLTPVKGPPNLCNRFYVGTGFLLHKFGGPLTGVNLDRNRCTWVWTWMLCKYFGPSNLFHCVNLLGECTISSNSITGFPFWNILQIAIKLVIYIHSTF